MAPGRIAPKNKRPRLVDREVLPMANLRYLVILGKVGLDEANALDEPQPSCIGGRAHFPAQAVGLGCLLANQRKVQLSARGEERDGRSKELAKQRTVHGGGEHAVVIHVLNCEGDQL